MHMSVAALVQLSEEDQSVATGCLCVTSALSSLAHRCEVDKYYLKKEYSFFPSVDIPLPKIMEEILFAHSAARAASFCVGFLSSLRIAMDSGDVAPRIVRVSIVQ